MNNFLHSKLNNSRGNSNEDKEAEHQEDFADTYENLINGMKRAESDLADVISEDDRERIMETERTLMESSMCSIVSGGESEGEGRRGGGMKRGMVRGRKTSRRRRRLPEIPKNKKRKFDFSSSKLNSQVIWVC